MRSDDSQKLNKNRLLSAYFTDHHLILKSARPECAETPKGEKLFWEVGPLAPSLERTSSDIHQDKYVEDACDADIKMKSSIWHQIFMNIYLKSRGKTLRKIYESA